MMFSFGVKLPVNNAELSNEANHGYQRRDRSKKKKRVGVMKKKFRKKTLDEKYDSIMRQSSKHEVGAHISMSFAIWFVGTSVSNY